MVHRPSLAQIRHKIGFGQCQVLLNLSSLFAPVSPYHLTHLTASCILAPGVCGHLSLQALPQAVTGVLCSVVICLIPCPCCWQTSEAGAPTRSGCSLGQGKFRQQHTRHKPPPPVRPDFSLPGNKLHPGSRVHRLLPGPFLGRYSLSWHPTSSQFILAVPVPLPNFASCLHLSPGTHLSVPARLGLWPVFLSPVLRVGMEPGSWMGPTNIIS